MDADEKAEHSVELFREMQVAAAGVATDRIDSSAVVVLAMPHPPEFRLVEEPRDAISAMFLASLARPRSAQTASVKLFITSVAAVRSRSVACRSDPIISQGRMLSDSTIEARR